MNKPLNGKVAALLDERTLAINIGAEAGVEIGMYFMIYDAEGRKIVDPDTNKVLGHHKISKRAVRVTETSPTFAVAETFKHRTVNVGGTSSVMSNFSTYLSSPKYVKRYETFAIGAEDKKTIDEGRSLIKIGDVVEQIDPPEDEE